MLTRDAPRKHTCLGHHGIEVGKRCKTNCWTPESRTHEKRFSRNYVSVQVECGISLVSEHGATSEPSRGSGPWFPWGCLTLALKSPAGQIPCVLLDWLLGLKNVICIFSNSQMQEHFPNPTSLCIATFPNRQIRNRSVYQDPRSKKDLIRNCLAFALLPCIAPKTHLIGSS